MKSLRSFSFLLPVGTVLALATSFVSGRYVEAAEDPFAFLRVQRVIPPAPAPAVAIPNVTGGFLTLSELRGKVVILGFFVTT